MATPSDTAKPTQSRIELYGSDAATTSSKNEGFLEPLLWLLPAVLKISDRRRLTQAVLAVPFFLGSCQNVQVMERRKVESMARPQLDLDPMTFRSCPAKTNVDQGNLEQAKRAERGSRGGNMWSGTQISSPMGFVTLFRGKCGCKMT